MTDSKLLKPHGKFQGKFAIMQPQFFVNDQCHMLVYIRSCSNGIEHDVHDIQYTISYTNWFNTCRLLSHARVNIAWSNERPHQGKGGGKTAELQTLSYWSVDCVRSGVFENIYEV